MHAKLDGEFLSLNTRASTNSYFCAKCLEDIQMNSIDLRSISLGC